MNHIKLFENYNNIMDQVDDIAAYFHVHTSNVCSRWILPNFSKILTESEYVEYKASFRGSDKSIRRIKLNYKLNDFALFLTSDSTSNRLPNPLNEK